MYISYHASGGIFAEMPPDFMYISYHASGGIVVQKNTGRSSIHVKKIVAPYFFATARIGATSCSVDLYA